MRLVRAPAGPGDEPLRLTSWAPAPRSPSTGAGWSSAPTPIPALRNGVTLHPDDPNDPYAFRVDYSAWAWARCQWSSRPPATGVGYNASGSTSWRSTSAPTCAIPAACEALTAASSRQASPAWPERPRPDLLATPTEGGLSRAIGTHHAREWPRHITLRDVSLYVDVVGRGDPVVLMHGGPSADLWTMGSFRGLADQCTVVLYDHRCNGRSTGPPAASMTRENLTADADALREYLGFDRWAVLGHLRRPRRSGVRPRYPRRVSRLVLVDTTTPAGPARTPRVLSQRGYSPAQVELVRRWFNGEFASREYLPIFWRISGAYMPHHGLRGMLRELAEGGWRSRIRPEPFRFAGRSLLPGWSVATVLARSRSPPWSSPVARTSSSARMPTRARRRNGRRPASPRRRGRPQPSGREPGPGHGGPAAVPRGIRDPYPLRGRMRLCRKCKTDCLKHSLSTWLAPTASRRDAGHELILSAWKRSSATSSNDPMPCPS